MTRAAWPLAALLACAAALAARALRLALANRRGSRRRRGAALPRPSPTLVVLGSGGHTAEMLALLRSRAAGAALAPRAYVVAATDAIGAGKARAHELAVTADARRAAGGLGATRHRGAHRAAGDAARAVLRRISLRRGGALLRDAMLARRLQPRRARALHVWLLTRQLHITSHPTIRSAATRVRVIPRSREVGQGWLSTVATTLVSCLCALWIVAAERPRVLLCNGPGTCLPLIGAAFAWRVVGLVDTRVAYVESVARVKVCSDAGPCFDASPAGYRVQGLGARISAVSDRARRSVCAGRGANALKEAQGLLGELEAEPRFCRVRIAPDASRLSHARPSHASRRS